MIIIPLSVERLILGFIRGKAMDIGRRSTVIGMIAAVIGSRPGLAQPVRELEPSASFTTENPRLATSWMDQWMKVDKRPVGGLHVSRFADPIYFLLRPIGWEPPARLRSYPKITVPTGFVTDFASVPQVFWSALRPDGLYTYPAIVHDWLYWTQDHTKEIADNIFKAMMEDFSVPALTVFAIYESVRLFGGSAWEGNARLKSQGERRVLARYPTEPTTTWAEWKKNADVFK
jgi:hypothetical protein